MKEMTTLGIIPARYASTRFEGKPLADIAGRSMIQRVYEGAAGAACLDALCVATDDGRIFQAVESFGGKAVMTSPLHPNGTSRCLEAAQRVLPGCDVVVNIQGDEPLIHPEQIELLAGMFDQPGVDIATLAKRIEQSAEISDPNVVKVTFGKSGKALRFERSTGPPQDGNCFKHIGLYAYRLPVLREIVRLPVAEGEQRQSLEQLRWMAHGFEVYVAETQRDSISVDSPGDIDKVLGILRGSG